MFLVFLASSEEKEKKYKEERILKNLLCDI